MNCALNNSVFAGKNPFEGYIPEVPDGERMDFGSESFVDNERQGVHTPVCMNSILSLRSCAVLAHDHPHVVLNAATDRIAAYMHTSENICTLPSMVTLMPGWR